LLSNYRKKGENNYNINLVDQQFFFTIGGAVFKTGLATEIWVDALDPIFAP